jgi:thymidylate synthase (FAD)
MRIIDPSYEITFHVPEGYKTVEQFIEAVARTCYKSEDKITEGSADKFIGGVLMTRNHSAMIEHCVATVRFVADRGFTHELVRHRLASFAQESTRYCNYAKGKFDNQITVISLPEDTNPSEELKEHYQKCMVRYERDYFKAIKLGAQPQIARMWLPIGLKAEIVMTANLREWLTVFGLRADTAAHPIIRKVMRRVFRDFSQKVPSIYKKKFEEYLFNHALNNQDVLQVMEGSFCQE